MVRLVARTVILVASSAPGLIVADVLLVDASVSPAGLLVTLVIFAVPQSVTGRRDLDRGRPSAAPSNEAA